jgi:hypothetical protein
VNSAKAAVAFLGAATLVTCVLLALGLAPNADANAPIISYSALPSTTQAGGHPDVLVEFATQNRFTQNSQSLCNCEDPKDATVHLPIGFIGNPGTLPRCSIADFSADECPIDSQIGMVEVSVGGFGGGLPFLAAIYNVTPPPDVPGLLAFKLILLGAPQFTILSARTDSDYGLDAKATSLYHGHSYLEKLRQILWGVPADPSHDAYRFDPELTILKSPNYLGEFCDASGAKSTSDPKTVVKPCGFQIPPPMASNSPLTPFLQNPTTCAAPLATSLDLLSYDGGTDHADAIWPQPTGCNQLSFNPSLYAQPTTVSTDSASGADVNLSVPQSMSPTIPSPSELRAASVTLPPGFSLNSNGADGKVACTDAAARFGTRDAAECPEYAKVGTLVIENPALPGPLPGFVYLGEPKAGNRFRLLLVADGFATHVKIPGTITPDPQTGQLTVSFENLPQQPLTAFNMHFFGSERGALATPTECGTYPVTSTFVPWNERQAPQTSIQYFTLEQGPEGKPCPGRVRPFSPRFAAASAGNTAGAHVPFSVDVARDDGDQNLQGLAVKTPPGFAASLKGIPYCPDSALAQLGNPLYPGASEIFGSACPPASQIGTVTAGAGAGARPLHVSGRVYLAGPYRGAPLSLMTVIPAVSGPYDLGNVAVRAAVRVDPVTGEVTTESDPLPQIIEGIPLRGRSLRVNLDRPGFTLNPTNCERFSVDADIAGSEGTIAHVSDPYQVANCQSLPYAPKLEMVLTGGLRRRGHPAIQAVLTTTPGEANSRSISVTLPKGELLDNSHIQTVCTRVAFAQEECPAGSRLGRATVSTRILDEPLTGDVYLRSSDNRLPDLVLDLEGQIDIVAAAKIDSVRGRLRTTFPAIPDAPAARITLDLAGGSKGLLQNTESLCGENKRATARMMGQNGVAYTQRPKLQVNCRSAAARLRQAEEAK